LVWAIATGALRALLLKYDGCADQPLLVGVPMSIDTSPARISGNAIGTVVASLPVEVVDPSSGAARWHRRDDRQGEHGTTGARPRQPWGRVRTNPG
jgi:hypothetical protein